MQFVRQSCPQVTLVLLGNGAIAEPLQRLPTICIWRKAFCSSRRCAYQDVPRYVNLCDVGIMAYPNSEYWKYNNPIKLLEYLALGKPVIVRDMITFRSVVGGHAGAVFIQDHCREPLLTPLSKPRTMGKLYAPRVYGEGRSSSKSIPGRNRA